MCSKINVLCVDDKVENLLALEEILHDLPVNMLKASSGEDALHLILQEECALLLMDVRMPGMDGYETAALIRKRRKSEQIPIIFISAVNTEPEHVFKGYSSGAVDYLFKPIIPEVLKSKVRIFLELHQQKQKLQDKARELQLAGERIALQQKALQASEVRFRTAFEQSFQFMAILDPQGRIIELNRLAEKLCGEYSSSLIGRFLWDVCWVNQEEENLRLQKIITQAAAGECVCDEAAFVAADDRQHFFYRAVAPVKDTDGNVIYVTVQGHDVTEKILAEREKRNLETLLQQAQKMEALGALAGGIAHDFNNVLSVIIGNADLAENNCEKSSLQYQHLRRIHEASSKAKELVKQILSFSRRAEIEKIVIEPAKIVLESIKLLRSSIPTTIDIVHDIDHECGCIFADPTQYHQIIMNLCTNAFHAMENSGGTLSIQLRQENIISKQHCLELAVNPGEYAHLTVEDSGAGIEEKHLERIFDPYFTTKEKDKGTGMGLAIVHGIVKGHGGAVCVESSSDKGAAFHVYLPLAKEQGAQKEKAFDELSYGSERILLVDDEKLLLEMEKDMLELIGYRVTAINSSPEALRLFSENPLEFDLVITDQTMPRMTGMELAEEMLRLRPATPIILCTGYSPNISKESVVSRGIRELAYKPLALEELSAIIRRTLDQNR
ncbi:MAG: response regulator [Desulfopila sp.]|jgi:PAS domain S-box-containing protein|nr:response regulator [Desulfopila sp.]